MSFAGAGRKWKKNSFGKISHLTVHFFSGVTVHLFNILDLDFCWYRVVWMIQCISAGGMCVLVGC